MRISKSVSDGKTYTKGERLDTEGRKYEISPFMFLQIPGISEHLFGRFELKFGDIESTGYPCYFIFSALGIKAFDLCVGLAVRDGFADSS